MLVTRYTAARDFGRGGFKQPLAGTIALGLLAGISD
jgi:hypothetical protein